MEDVTTCAVSAPERSQGKSRVDPSDEEEDDLDDFLLLWSSDYARASTGRVEEQHARGSSETTDVK